MSNRMPQPDFSDPRKWENNPHKKKNQGPETLKELLSKARKELTDIKVAAEKGELDHNRAIVGLMRAVGIGLNACEMAGEAGALAMRDGDAARNVMRQVGHESREALDSHKAEINDLKQRVTKLEGGA